MVLERKEKWKKTLRKDSEGDLTDTGSLHFFYFPSALASFLASQLSYILATCCSA
jgi:hypothetical protein